MTTRAQARKDLAALYTTSGSFNAVYAYAPTDLAGMDKVLCIYATGTRLDFITADMNNDFHSFNLDTYVKRESGSAAEDTMDSLGQAVRSVARNNISGSAWNDLSLSSKSNCLFAEVSGKPYRVERFMAVLKVTV